MVVSAVLSNQSQEDNGICSGKTENKNNNDGFLRIPSAPVLPVDDSAKGAMTNAGMRLFRRSADFRGLFSRHSWIYISFLRIFFSRKCFKNALTVWKLSFSTSRYYLIPH